jgi:hypothetical protein
MKPLKFRQVHLDFHTSEVIEGIGKDFNKQQFQDALKQGHVDSITVFSKCHHGWAYHPSKANVMHPHLEFDLLGAMVDAAHEIGVNTPVYLSAGLDEKIARKHPDWLYRNKDESTTWVPDFNTPGFHLFCFNNPYLEILLNQIEEVVKNYDADGIFLDIVKPKPCYCQNCVQSLLDEGKDPYDEKNALEFGERVYANYTEKVRETIDKYKPSLPVFHNVGHIAKGRRDLAHMNTHLELESLPTGGWGYDHFPLSARYAQTLGMEFLGMTGKFHTMWGEFGGFKHPNALKYEAALSIANGAKCSIGDQLHPRGLMDPLTYNIIGAAYKEVEEKEPWCTNVTSVADVAVLSYESTQINEVYYRDTENWIDVGATRALLQNHILFDVIDTTHDFAQYKVIVLPDAIRLDEMLQTKLLTYVGNGGKLLATGESGLAIERNEFALDFGVKWEGHCLNQPNYFKSDVELPVFNDASFVFYEASEQVSLTTGISLARKEKSYFNRETFHFCSHQHTPDSFVDDGPGMVESSTGIYIPWKLFSDYAKIGSLPMREVITYALKRLLGDQQTIKTNLPSQGVVTMMQQSGPNRHVIHLLYASPVLRGNSSVTQKPIEIIEDLIPIYNTSIELKVNKKINKLYLAPQMVALDYQQSGDSITFNVDQFTCHQMIVVE